MGKADAVPASYSLREVHASLNALPSKQPASGSIHRWVASELQWKLLGTELGWEHNTHGSSINLYAVDKDEKIHWCKARRVGDDSLSSSRFFLRLSLSSVPRAAVLCSVSRSLLRAPATRILAEWDVHRATPHQVEREELNQNA